jgi:glycosyltransferase involved in cell wall biosynthesis
MNLIITAKMGNGTIQAKLEPLARIEKVANIYFLRKTAGPEIPKVKYIVLPAICKISIFNLILTPFLLSYYTVKLRASYIISYHIIPYAFIASIASLLTRKPYFVCQTGLLVQKEVEKKWLWFVLKKVLLGAKKFCVPGNNSYAFWNGKGIPASNIQILHSSIDTDKIRPRSFCAREYDFIYIGRIAWEKRIDFLIKAFSALVSKYPKIKLLIIGDGPLLIKIKDLVNELRLVDHIHFAGYQTEVLPWVQKAKFIVMTSETEGLPCSIMEGMSAGLIPVTTNAGNLQDIVINGDTGFIVEKDDVVGFANAMDFLLEREEKELAGIRKRAREIIVRDHSHNSSLQAWERLLFS